MTPGTHRILRPRLLTAALLGFVGLLALRPVRADPALSLVQPTMTLDNASDGRASMLLQASGLDDETMKAAPASVMDMGTPDPPGVQMTWSVAERPGLDKTRAWLVVGTVKGLPRDSRQVRYLAVTFAGRSTVLEYTLTNHSDVAFAWTIAGPSGLQHLAPREAVPISVVVGPVPATGVTLLHRELPEATARTPWARGHVELCQTGSGVCRSPSTLAANSANTLYLRASSTPDSYGHFTGTVTLAAAEKPAGDSVALDMSFTSQRRQVAGPFVILLGVLLAWSVSGWGKAKSNRDQLLLPAALYQEQYRTLLQRLKTLHNRSDAVFPRTSTLLTTQIDNLSEASLVAGGYISPVVWAAYAATTVDPAKYKAFLDQNGQWIAVLPLILDGFEQALQFAAAGSANYDKVGDCIRSIDALSVPGPPQPKDAIIAAIASAQAKLVGVNARSTATQIVEARDTRSLIVELRHLSLWAWVVAALTTTLIGTYVLVLSDLGFGSPLDYLKCLFWGFGLPIGAAQLGQLTSSSANTTLGLNVSG